MDQEKIGKFIAKCRKDKKLTQSELAEKLGVTDKSISNWENGRKRIEKYIFKNNKPIYLSYLYYNFIYHSKIEKRKK